MSTKHARTNYRMIAPFLATVDLTENGGHKRFESSGYMPLSIENLGYTHNGLPVYSVMHWYTQNGDLMRDPDMTIAVDHSGGTVEPLTYQQDGLGLYQEVYDGPNRYRPRLRSELDEFLWQWLKNILDQGFDPQQDQKTMKYWEVIITDRFGSRRRQVFGGSSIEIVRRMAREYVRENGLSPAEIDSPREL